MIGICIPPVSSHEYKFVAINNLNLFFSVLNLLTIELFFFKGKNVFFCFFFIFIFVININSDSSIISNYTCRMNRRGTFRKTTNEADDFCRTCKNVWQKCVSIFWLSVIARDVSFISPVAVDNKLNENRKIGFIIFVVE